MSPTTSAASSTSNSWAASKSAHTFFILSNASMPRSPSTPFLPRKARLLPVTGTKTAAQERTSVFLWRADLDLLRALYRGTTHGYSHHIRGAVAAMCQVLRAQLRKSDEGRALLRKLNQDHLQ